MTHPSIEEVLASHREEAAILRRNGLEERARDRERICDEIADALGTYLKWLSESEAALWCGHSSGWLRDRFNSLSARGDARKEGRHRLYRASALPQTLNPSDAKRRGEHLVGLVAVA